MIESSRKLPARNTNQMIQESLLELIQTQDFSSGDRLPSQHELAARLGVSHISLREALRALEALGVVEARVGSGWYVKHFSFDPVARALSYTIELDDITLADLNDIRICLECTFFPGAARSLRAEDIDELERLAGQMEQAAHAGASWRETDHAFHQLLFSRIDNRVFNELMEVFWELYRYWGPKLTLEDHVSRAQAHTKIVTVIRAGQIRLACELLRESLSFTGGRTM